MSDALVAALLHGADDATCVVARDGALTHFNGAFARLCESEPRIGRPLADVQESWLDAFRRAASGRIVTSDVRLVISGVERHFTLQCRPMRDGSGAVFIARDVTETSRRVREDLFELSLTRLFIEDDRPLDETLANALAYLCESDEWDSGVVWLEDEYRGALTAAAIHTRDDALRAHMADLRLARNQGLPGRAWASDDIVWVADLAGEAARSQFMMRIGLRGAVGVPVRDGAHTIGALELLTRDVRPISELRARALLRAGEGLGRLITRRRAEDERRRLLQVIERKGMEWSLTFDALELPIFITSMDGVIRRMNRAGLELAGGREYGDILGRRIGALGGRDEPWRTLASSIEAMRDSGQPCNAQAYHAESDRTWDIAASSYRSEDGVARAIVIARETTRVVRLQASVRRGEQLAALGELVAGVAHEVRNPIFGMQITVDTLEESLPGDADVGELLVVLRRWLERLNRLMESLLAYGRAWSVDLQEGTVDAAIAQAIETCRPIADAAKVPLDVAVEPTLPILMDASRLVHAFENLITNAVQHSAAHTAVRISAHVADGFVVCSVRDHGPGFVTADLPRIFEPFFTKRRGGTGLGLAIVQRIVEEHGGTLDACNADNGGALITIRFPVYLSRTQQ